MRSKKFPTLYGLSKNGKIKQWNIEVKADSEKLVRIIVHHGYTDSDKSVKERLLRSGKNVGRANETSVFEQAVSECRSAWAGKIDEGYVTSIEDLRSIPLRPMLAHTYSVHKGKVLYPCYIQPKLNGVRALAKFDAGRVEFYSRNGKLLSALKTHPELNDEVLEVLQKHPDMVLDGELYIHNTPFQDIVSYVKAPQPGTKKLQYWVYDMVDTNKPFKERTNYIHHLINVPGFKCMRIVSTYVAPDENHIIKYHQSFMGDGFEGSMIRSRNGKYVPNYRSYDLLKHKDFVEEEFKIVGGMEDNDGGIVWVCKSPHAKRSDNVFNVRMVGPLKVRQQMVEEANKHFGKKLTVRYQELSKHGIPIFPVGISVRDYE